VTDLRALDEGGRRRGSTGKHVTMKAIWNRGTTTRVAPGGDEGNPSWVGLRILPAPTREWLEAGDQRGDLVAKGCATGAVGDDDGGRPKGTTTIRGRTRRGRRENAMKEGATWVWRRGGREGNEKKIL
jgi:hypothetical protein